MQLKKSFKNHINFDCVNLKKKILLLVYCDTFWPRSQLGGSKVWLKHIILHCTYIVGNTGNALKYHTFRPSWPSIRMRVYAKRKQKMGTSHTLDHFCIQILFPRENSRNKAQKEKPLLPLCRVPCQLHNLSLSQLTKKKETKL